MWSESAREHYASDWKVFAHRSKLNLTRGRAVCGPVNLGFCAQFGLGFGVTSCLLVEPVNVMYVGWVWPAAGDI